MPTPQEEAAEAERTRDRLEQAAMILFAAYLTQQSQPEGDSAQLPEMDLIRIRRLISEVVGWYHRELSRMPGVDNREQESDSEYVEQLLPVVVDQVKALKQWMKNAPPRNPGELSLQRNAARALATTVFNSVGHAVSANMDPDLPAVRKIWITRKDDRVRRLHRQLHGRVKDMDKDFWRWPVTGQRLRFPGDPLAPLDATIGCRCILVMSAMNPEDVRAAFPPLPPEDKDK